jgi:vancomycin resistance protein YoaR
MKPVFSLTKIFVGALVLLVFFSLNFLFILNLLFSTKIMPGIYIGQITLAGLTKSQAHALLSDLSARAQKEKITFSYDQKNWQATSKELGGSYDIYQTIEKAYFSGRENFFAPLIFPIRSLFSPIRLEPVYIWDRERFQKWEEKLKLELEEETQEAKIELVNGKLKFKEGKVGREIDQQNLEASIKDRISSFSFLPIVINLKVKKPAITAEDAWWALEAAEKITAKKIILTFEDRRWEIDKKTLLSFLDLAQASQVEGFTAPLSKLKIAKFIDDIGQELDQPPQDAKLTVQDGKVKIFQPAENGLRLNRQEAKGALSAKLLEDTQSEINIALAVLQSPPKIKTEDVNNIGIKEMLGKGTSNFSGSQKERIFNIELASLRINGTLIAPGEIFSFNQAVGGDISEKTGYKTAYIIERGRTIFGTGGGVCQVSTTVFRAAIFSGLPIVERHPHAYRVHYYEKAGHPVGLDATIYIPERDFKFKNDTAGHLIVVAKVDRKINTLTFELWGTSDGRKTEVSKPVIRNSVPPPEPLYEEDPTLPKGTTKQADFAAWGADVTITRKVTRGQETLIDEKIFSHYKAWRAIFKVGTKEQ